MPSDKHYAHSLKDRPVDEWHLLDAHLKGTSDRAEVFAHSFATGWGTVAGLLHDAGKYQLDFQRRIGAGDPDAHTNQSVDHSSVGALIAKRGRMDPLTFIIAGHHGGLPNIEDLRSRLADKEYLLPRARENGMPNHLETIKSPSPPTFVGTDKRKYALWTRFLFSALVDADFLDTEAFYSGERDLRSPALEDLLPLLEREIERLTNNALQTGVNGLRKRVVDACAAAAESGQGAFTLTVPTGGGKTLSSLLFALRHAVKHKLKRVIVVIPFTSIIEQTAGVYRKIFGDTAVIEHHSNLDPDKESHLNRIASENWDAPLIVTTSVQFFESLFANRPSRCRKLHRIPESVVVFDEVQTFPPGLIISITDTLRQLVADYRTSIVLCTATQPALDAGKTVEIFPAFEDEFDRIAGRCNFSFPQSEEPSSWSEIASRAAEHDRVLVIVNKRKDAEELARLLGDSCYHLSARMCPSHRTVVLDNIRRILRDGGPCRVVSTQLVEAGVDLDFPVVFRAFAGADSMAQAAGRCNREDGVTPGELHIFLPPTEPPKGILLTAKQRAFSMWKAGKLSLADPATFREYFRLLYQSVGGDESVLTYERGLQFEDVAKEFQMIDTQGETVIAPFGDAPDRIEDVRKLGINRRNLRRLQPFSVQLYPQEVNQLSKQGALSRLEEKLWVVTRGYEAIYSNRFGFAWQGGSVFAEPDRFIA